jgi:lipid-A-disaccharide synthase
MNAPSSDLFISAGEISGDMHGGRLLREIRKLDPAVTAFGIGGPELESAGLEKHADISQLSLVGIAEVIPRLFSLLRLLAQAKATIEERRPRAVILIDAPDFNLPLARHAHRLGIKVIYYIGPTIWAWRPRRLRTIAAHVDLMLTILPFEEAIYRSHGVRVRYVGNPLVDSARPSKPSDRFLSDLGLGLDGEGPIIAVLPGSRGNEVRALLPALLGACRILAGRKPSPRFLFPAASPELYDLLCREAGDLSGATIVRGQAVDCLAAATAAIVTSGTSTLEAALVQTPFATVYRLSTLSYLAGRLLVKTPWISLPNILAGRPVVEEFIQARCRADLVAAAVARLLDDERVFLQMKAHFATIRQNLGPGGSAGLAAETILRETDPGYSNPAGDCETGTGDEKRDSD